MAREHWAWGGVGAYVPLPSTPCRAVSKPWGAGLSFLPIHQVVRGQPLLSSLASV